MPQYYESGDVIPMAMYRIGHSNDSSREPLFTMDKDKAMQLTVGSINEMKHLGGITNRSHEVLGNYC